MNPHTAGDSQTPILLHGAWVIGEKHWPIATLTKYNSSNGVNHLMKTDPTTETVRDAFARFGHAAINLGPELIEGIGHLIRWKWITRNPQRHLIGKVLALWFWFLIAILVIT